MRINFFNLFLLITFLFLSNADFLAQINWTKHSGNPVLPAGPNGAWDRHKFLPSILYNADSLRYEMWFTASEGSATGWLPYRIGFATSEDGIDWTVYPDPVLTPGSAGEWDSLTVAGPRVVLENGVYRMWYSSGGPNYTQYKIGFATSSDGINWVKFFANPILQAGAASWEAGGVYTGSVMPVSGGYKMWYEGYDVSQTNNIGYATSPDGLAWERDTLNNPVLENGNSGQWDDGGVYLPWVLFIDNIYYMWYGGYDGTIERVGLATSFDGLSWTKYENNPVLGPSAGQWDDYWIECGVVILKNDTLYMWYDASGGSGSNYLWQIGLATSPFEPVSVDDQETPPSDFILSQNYPNPFNPTTTFRYSIPTQSKVVIKLYDILGNEIATLIDKEKQVGTYEITWQAADLPSGVYFYQLKAGTFIQTKKMLLLK